MSGCRRVSCETRRKIARFRGIRAAANKYLRTETVVLRATRREMPTLSLYPENLSTKPFWLRRDSPKKQMKIGRAV